MESYIIAVLIKLFVSSSLVNMVRKSPCTLDRYVGIASDNLHSEMCGDICNHSADGTETVVRPEGVIARDENDYYLVVAADKGTAAFSDTANAISLERGFWLGDAFASGGSVG